jgi:hypothetical protein
MSNKQPTQYVVLGIDGANNPRAAKFAEAEATAACKAAELMGLRLGKADSEKALAALKDIPAGKIFETGKGLVPLVKRELYDQLEKLLTFDPKAAVPSGGPDPWAKLKVGSMALVFDKVNGEGWFEAVVLEVSKNEETLTMRWRDAPELKKFKAARRAVSILSPVRP